jgi:hypothetical protein
MASRTSAAKTERDAQWRRGMMQGFRTLLPQFQKQSVVSRLYALRAHCKVRGSMMLGDASAA